MNYFLRAKIFFKILIQQLLNPLTYVLLLAAAILAVIGTGFDVFVIIAILLFSAVLGAVQQYRVAYLINKLNTSQAQSIQASKSQVGLKNYLKQVSYFILFFISITCLLLFIIGLLTGKHLPELLTMLTGLFVCAVPEGLPLALKLASITAAAAGYTVAEQDQAIFAKFQRVLLFFFATNLGEILVVFGALVLSLPIPILPSQFLWLNLVTDGLLSVALAVEPVELDHNIKKNILIDRAVIFKITYRAILMGALAFGVFYLRYPIDLPKARSLTLLVIVLFQICHAWACVLTSKSLFSCHLLKYKYLMGVSLLIVLIQALMGYLSFI